MELGSWIGWNESFKSPQEIQSEFLALKFCCENRGSNQVLQSISSNGGPASIALQTSPSQELCLPFQLSISSKISSRRLPRRRIRARELRGRIRLPLGGVERVFRHLRGRRGEGPLSAVPGHALHQGGDGEVGREGSIDG